MGSIHCSTGRLQQKHLVASVNRSVQQNTPHALWCCSVNSTVSYSTAHQNVKFRKLTPASHLQAPQVTQRDQ
jgi:hypothetical protein